MRWVLLYLFAGQVALGAKDTSGWPMFRRSPRHDACSPARGPVRACVYARTALSR